MIQSDCDEVHRMVAVKLARPKKKKIETDQTKVPGNSLRSKEPQKRSTICFYETNRISPKRKHEFSF